MADAEFKARITADDQASKTLEEIAAAAEKLDSTDATVAVAAEDEATPVLEGATEAVETLDGEDATVGVAAEDEATPTLEEVQGATDALDGAQASVAVDADDQASGTLDQVQGEVDDLDGAGAEVTATVADEATDTLVDIQGEVDALDATEAEVTATVDDQASGAVDDISTSLGGLVTQLELLPGALGEVTGLLGGLGAAGGAAAGVAAIGAAVGSAVTDFENLNIAIGDFVTATGTSFDDASRLIEVTGDIGINADTLEKAISKMNLAAGKTPAAFDEIGASIARNKDGTLNVKETFLGVVTALGQIDDAQKRTEAGRAILGNGWRAMAPLIREDAETVRAALASVGEEKIGSEEKTAEADALRASLDTLADATDKLKQKFGEALAPAVGGLAEAAGGAVDALAPLITEIGGELSAALTTVTPLIKLFGDSLKAWTTLEVKLPGGDSFKPFMGSIGAATDSWGRLHDAIMGPDLEGKISDTFGAVKEGADGAKDSTEEAAAEWDAARGALEEFTTKLAMNALKVGEASVKMGELGSALDQIGLRQDALAQVFKLDDGPRKAAGEVRDIGLAIDDLGEKAKGIDVGDALANGVKSDKFLDAIDKLAPQVQAAVTKAFGSGGPEAATKLADEYIDQVTAELGGKFTREQVATMLGLDNIKATVAVALEMSSVETAKRQLAILTGLKGETPYTASIALALDAGTITGEQAQVLIQDKLRDANVEVPSSLAAPQTDEAIAAAQAALDAGEPVRMVVDADITAAQERADEAAAYADSLVGTEGIEAESDKARAEADAAKAYADSLVGTEGVDADTAEANAKAAAAKAYTDSLIGTEGVDGDPDAAIAAADAAKKYTDSLTGTTTIAGDNSSAKSSANDAKRYADGLTATIPVYMQLASTIIPGLAELLKPRTIPVRPSASSAVPAGPTATTTATTAAPAPYTTSPSPWPAPVINVAAPVIPPIVVKLDGRPVAALIGSTTAPAVRAAAMAIRAGRA